MECMTCSHFAFVAATDKKTGLWWLGGDGIIGHGIVGGVKLDMVVGQTPKAEEEKGMTDR